MQPLGRMRLILKVRVDENSRRANQTVRTIGASDRAICDPYAHNGQLQLKASDLGHCAVYEKELERVCPDN